MENKGYIFKEACLLLRYLAMDILLLHAYVSWECVNESLPSNECTRHNTIVLIVIVHGIHVIIIVIIVPLFYIILNLFPSD